MMLRCPHCDAILGVELILRGLAPLVEREPANERWRDVPLAKMELSARAFHALRNNEKWDGEKYVPDGAATAGEIADMSDGELLRLPNFGRHSLRDVRREIERLKAGV